MGHNEKPTVNFTSSTLSKIAAAFDLLTNRKNGLVTGPLDLFGVLSQYHMIYQPLQFRIHPQS